MFITCRKTWNGKKIYIYIKKVFVRPVFVWRIFLYWRERERERVLLNDKFIFFVISRFKICMNKVFGSPSCISISWDMGGHSTVLWSSMQRSTFNSGVIQYKICVCIYVYPRYCKIFCSINLSKTWICQFFPFVYLLLFMWGGYGTFLTHYETRSI